MNFYYDSSSSEEDCSSTAQNKSFTDKQLPSIQWTYDEKDYDERLEQMFFDMDAELHLLYESWIRWEMDHQPINRRQIEDEDWKRQFGVWKICRHCHLKSYFPRLYYFMLDYIPEDVNLSVNLSYKST